AAARQAGDAVRPRMGGPPRPLGRGAVALAGRGLRYGGGGASHRRSDRERRLAMNAMTGKAGGVALNMDNPLPGTETEAERLQGEARLAALTAKYGMVDARALLQAFISQEFPG